MHFISLDHILKSARIVNLFIFYSKMISKERKKLPIFCMKEYYEMVLFCIYLFNLSYFLYFPGFLLKQSELFGLAVNLIQTQNGCIKSSGILCSGNRLNLFF